MVDPVATTGRFWVILVGEALSVVLSFHPPRRYVGSLRVLVFRAPSGAQPSDRWGRETDEVLLS